jgi:CBS domain
VGYRRWRLAGDENDRLVGMITDRDIAVRAVALGKGPETPVREIMTSDVKYCFEDVDTDDVACNMGDQRVRRPPVVNRDKRLVGILSLGDIALTQGGQTAGEALAGPTGRRALDWRALDWPASLIAARWLFGKAASGPPFA